MPPADLTHEIANRSSALAFDDLPGDVVEVTRQALLDWFGVTLSGSHEPAPQILLGTLGAGGDDGVTVVGHEQRLAPLSAALLNGTASHVLDFDDFNPHFLGHASVAVAGAALALAEHLDAPGTELIAAFVAGYETACRIAVALGSGPYARGFHYTGTVGTFGAAAACARLLALGEAETAIALGIAASQAAGLKSNFGTMTKSLHAGKACESGLLAALLASNGFTSSPDSIEGFARSSGGDTHAAAALADPPAGWYVLDNLFKYHASCYWTHSTIEGVLSLALDWRDVASVEIHVSDLELGTCVIPSPAKGLEVKFSIAHLAAMSLLGRDLTVIEDADASDEVVVQLRDRIRLVEDRVAGEPTRVVVRLRDGSELEAAVDVNTASRDLTAQHERLSLKFLRLAEPVIGPAPADRLRTMIRSLGGGGGGGGGGGVGGVGVRDLMGLTRPAS